MILINPIIDKANGKLSNWHIRKPGRKDILLTHSLARIQMRLQCVNWMEDQAKSNHLDIYGHSRYGSYTSTKGVVLVINALLLLINLSKEVNSILELCNNIPNQ